MMQKPKILNASSNFGKEREDNNLYLIHLPFALIISPNKSRACAAVRAVGCCCEGVTSGRSANTHAMNVCVFAAFVAIVSIIVYNCPVAYSLEDKTYRMSENCIWLFEEIWSSCSKKALWTGLWADYRIRLERVNFKQISSSRVFWEENVRPLVNLFQTHCTQITKSQIWKRQSEKYLKM